MTVALALLAFELAGDDAGAVLGTALAIKMIAYVGLAPVAGAFATRVPRRALLVGLDLVRASVALALPFVDQIWQIYVLIAILQSASAAFTPTFQATIPDILPDERDYTNALSLSRLAYDLENLLSPLLAAMLVALIGFHWLFGGTVIGFLVSAALIVLVRLPAADRQKTQERFTTRVAKGLRIYLATPRLRGLLAINLSVAAAGAMVIVNTVVVAKGMLGLTNAGVALAMAAFGAGSMISALAMPRLLERLRDRTVMIPAAGAMALILLGFAGAVGVSTASALWPLLLATWLPLGVGYSAAQVPVGRLLRRSAHAEDRPAVYAAQFALSHACWLVTYPLAGWIGSTAGLPTTLIVLGIVAGVGAALAARLWPVTDPDVVGHIHPDLRPDHPHLKGTVTGRQHAHAYIIDDLHAHWPRPTQ